MKRWPEKPLGEVCTINPKLSASDAPSPETVVTFVPMAAVDENSGSIQVPERRRYSEVAKGYTPFIDNDVLLAKITPCMQNGKAAIARDLSNGLGFGSTEFHILRPRKDILAAWVFAFIRHPQFRKAAEASFTGSAGQQRVPADFLKQFPIPVPPLAEQERIVNLLDEADELRKLRAKADRRSADLIPAVFHEMFGSQINSLPIALSCEGRTAPKGWRWACLTDVARLATGHTPSRRVPEYWNGNIPWICLTDIRALDGKVAYEISESVTEQGIKNSSSVKLPKGTVCFSRTASVGFVTIMGREMCTSQDFVNWVCGEELDSVYLMGALIQSRDYLRSLASGSTHKTIYFPTVEEFCVVVPPLTNQKEFAARVAGIRAMEAEQAASCRRLEDLFQSLLHRAFAGELSTAAADEVSVTVSLQPMPQQDATPPKHSKGIMYRRAALDCYLIAELKGDKNLGRTKIEKISHLMEYHCGVNLEREPLRDAAGPNDYPSRMNVESLAKKQKWYFTRKDKVKVDYLPGPEISKSRRTAENFLGERKSAVDALLALMRPLETTQSEIVATLYAAWNDFLLAGKTPPDDELITEVRHNWHQNKLRIPLDQWVKWLAWMRKNQLIPRGIGKPTIRNKSV